MALVKNKLNNNNYKAIEALKNRWKSAGLIEGDTVLVHSNIIRTVREFRRAGFALSALDVLQSFIDLLGSEGTLLLPLFNFDFTQGKPFDIRNTVSHMGALTEAGRLFHGSIRTGHPIYSFAVIGHHAGLFKDVNNISAYSENSPFGLLKKLNGKIAALDLEDQNCMTFYHHVEEVKQVDYRYHKSFCGFYTDNNGVSENRCYEIYVRDLSRGVQTNVNLAGEFMWRDGLYKGDRPKVKSGFRVVSARDMFNYVSAIIDDGKALGSLYILDAS